MTSTFAFFNLGAQEMIILLIIGVLLFGRKLPEVGRYLGKGIVEFKKGMKGMEDDLDANTSPRTDSLPPPSTPAPVPPQRVAPTVPKFEDNAGAVPPYQRPNEPRN